MLTDTSKIVDIQQLHVYQGDVLVLREVSFSLHRGEFVFLIGKTGSGKSTLIKTLYGELSCGATKAQVGSFDLNTILPNELPFLRRRLGIVFQDFQLLMDRTVEENLAFVLRATGWKDKKAIRDKIMVLLSPLGLDWTMQKMPYQLSGGEQQRIVIARALLNDPFLILADEPTGHLDPEVAGEILELFFAINRAGTAVLMATHNYDFLCQFPHIRILQCKQGLLMDGLPFNRITKELNEV